MFTLTFQSTGLSATAMTCTRQRSRGRNHGNHSRMSGVEVNGAEGAAGQTDREVQCAVFRKLTFTRMSRALQTQLTSSAQHSE